MISFHLAVIAAILFTDAVHGATIAELLQARSSRMSRMVAAIRDYPAWSASTGSITLFAPTDDAITAARDLGSNRLGMVYLPNTSINYASVPTNYFILNAANGVRVVYDDYRPRQPTPEIHIRSGVDDGICTEWLRADNGFLYIMPKAVPSPLNVATTLAAQGLTGFASLIEDAGLTSFFNNLTGVTVFAPDNDAVNAARSQWNGLSRSQKQAVLYYHTWASSTDSTSLNPGSISSGLPGASHTLALGNEQVTLDGNARVTLADIVTSAGYIHRINRVLIPSPLPASSANVTPSISSTGGNSTSTATVTATTRATAAATASAIGVTPSASPSSSNNVPPANNGQDPSNVASYSVLVSLFLSVVSLLAL